jgi:hypothetical protein
MGLMAIVFANHNTYLQYFSLSDSKCESVPTYLQGQYIWFGDIYKADF